MWVLCACIASVFAALVQCKSYLLLKLCLCIEDLRRLDIDDVKNSEYIEEEEIKRYSMAQKS